MGICGGKAQTSGGEVRLMETQWPDRPQGCPLGAYLNTNKEKIYTDVPKIHGKQLADISVSEKSMMPGCSGVTRGQDEHGAGGEKA